jgi:hypothetical protein
MASEQSMKGRLAASLGPSLLANRRWLLRGAVVAVAVLAALIAWLATKGGGEGSVQPASQLAPEARVVTPAELQEAAAALGQPIYWAGQVAGMKLELAELAGGGVQVFYVPENGEASNPRLLLTVGSYPLPDPTAALQSVAGRPGAIVRRARDGRKVVSSEGSRTSVYFASPDNSVQVEVYDPSSAQAMSLALSGRVQPAG